MLHIVRKIRRNEKFTCDNNMMWFSFYAIYVSCDVEFVRERKSSVRLFWDVKSHISGQFIGLTFLKLRIIHFWLQYVKMSRI